MAGVGIFDAALISYPLYRTSEAVVHEGEDETQVDRSELFRWLSFWMTYGGFKCVEQFGADGIPGFHFLKAGLLLSMWSREHSALMSIAVPKACSAVLMAGDRAMEWWNTTASPIVEQKTSWLGSLKERFWG